MSLVQTYLEDGEKKLTTKIKKTGNQDTIVPTLTKAKI